MRRLDVAAQDLALLFRSRHPLVVCETVEEQRFEALVRAVSSELTIPLWTWSAASGDVWIARDTGLFQRVLANLTLGPGAIRQGAVLVTVNFRDYGKPVTITAPIQ